MLFRVLIGSAFVLAGLLMYFAFNRGVTETPEVRQGAVQQVFPEPGTVALRQDAIGVQLAFGYDASLRIDRRAIPDDQLDHIAGINRISFTPGPGKEIEELSEGRHCAEVTYSPTPALSGAETATTTAAENRPYTWCFIAA